MHDLSAQDHVLSVLPLFHVGPLNIQTVPAFYTGATVTLTPKFDPGQTLKLIAGLRPSLIYWFRFNAGCFVRMQTGKNATAPVYVR